ncbi:hypothetical protein VW35_15315, partial [Devosia soli]
MLKIVLTPLLLLVMTCAAFAQGTTDFATLARDLSGGVSLAQDQVGWAGTPAEAFAAADTAANSAYSWQRSGLLTDAPA